MKSGFTTGSCSAAAAKAAVYMLLSGKEKNQIEIITPKGITFHADILEITRSENKVKCGVKKNAGDDPDITHGSIIFAEASYGDGADSRVIIDGGEGVGRVTKPGLDQPVGNAAINHVPREMITREVLEICRLFDCSREISIIISVPGGELLAEQTFNPRLGIIGGISIIGTSGVVEPMSEQALLDTIYLEMSQKRALGQEIIAVSPGNYGLDFMNDTFNYDLEKSVKCSNFIGETLDMAGELGFKGMLFTGHIGKLIKVSLGIMNTHSKYGDHRMEAIALAIDERCLKSEKIDEIKADIMEAATTEEAVRILADAGIRDRVMSRIMDKIIMHMRARIDGKYRIECMMYSNQHGMLAETGRAREMLAELER